MQGKFICHKCKHFCLNHGDGTGIGCLAFPDGIPEDANIRYSHHSVLKGQKGNFVFEEVQYEDLPPFTKWMWDKGHELGLD